MLVATTVIDAIPNRISRHPAVQHITRDLTPMDIRSAIAIEVKFERARSKGTGLL